MGRRTARPALRAGLGGALLACAVPAGAAGLGPTEQLQLVQVADPKIAPDGSAVAYVATGFDADHRSRSTVWLAALSGAPRELTPAPASAKAPRWSPDSRRLALLLRPAPDDEPRIALLDVAAGGLRELPDTRGARNLQWSPDGRHIAFNVRDRGTCPCEPARCARGDDVVVVDEVRCHVGLRLLDATSGAVRALGPSERTVWSFSWSPDGRELAVLASPTDDAEGQEYGSALFVVDVASQAWRRLAARANAHAAPSFSPDGRAIAYLAPLGDFVVRGVPHVVPRAGGEPRPLLADYPGNVFDLAWHPQADLLVIGLGEGERHYLATLDLGGRVEKRLEVRHSLMPYWEKTWSLSADGAEVAFTSEESNRPREVYRSRFAAGARPIQVSRANTALAAIELGAVEAVRWRNGEGAEVGGVLVHPPGLASGARAPLLVWLHGGPAYHWALGSQLSDWGQLFAAAGYRVLLPNFRGSSGYGMAWMRASVRDWGDGPLADVLSGVDHLVARGLADPHSVYVGGGSYGGYLTYWAVTHDTRFRAAALRAGVSELTSELALTDEPTFLLGYFGRSAFDDPEIYRQQSPLTHAARAKTPVLIVQGERDPRVPPSQSFLMYRALLHAGVEAQLVLYPREGHAISEYEHQLDHMKRVLDWYQRWNHRRADARHQAP